MNIKWLMLVVITCSMIALPRLFADELQMDNGDLYHGKVISVTTGAVTMDSEILGKITVPRNKVVNLSFGDKSDRNLNITGAANLSRNPNPSQRSASALLANTNVDLSAALRSLGGNTNFISQIREQMLGGNSAASGQYNQMINDLMSGKMDMNDLRRQAQSSADQIRELKRELGPDAGDSLDGYLQILDQFLKETTNQQPAAAKTPQSQAH